MNRFPQNERVAIELPLPEFIAEYHNIIIVGVVTICVWGIFLRNKRPTINRLPSQHVKEIESNIGFVESFRRSFFRQSHTAFLIGGQLFKRVQCVWIIVKE